MESRDQVRGEAGRSQVMKGFMELRKLIPCSSKEPLKGFEQMRDMFKILGKLPGLGKDHGFRTGLSEFEKVKLREIQWKCSVDK